MNNIFNRIKSFASQHPDKLAIAIVDNDDRVEVNYKSLVLDVELCAAQLSRSGILPGEVVAVVFPNGYDFVVAVLAVLSVGARLLPLNPGFREDEINFCLESSAVRAVFYPEDLGIVSTYVKEKSIIGFSGIAFPVSENDEMPSESDSGGLYMFSSGSTGKSKRISRSQQDILCEYEMLAQTVSLTGDEVFFCTIPLYHAHGFGNAMMSSLLSGSSLIISVTEFNARKVAGLLEEYAVTIFPVVPFILKIIAMTRFKSMPELDALRLVVSAGAPLEQSTCEKLLDNFNLSVSQLYGSTETGAMTINLSKEKNEFMSVGKPLNGIDIQIRNEDGGVLSADQEGELWIKSPAMTKGYDNYPELTDECFVDGWFFAGDLGRLDKYGKVFIIGRKKLLIIVAANKVDPLEVEGVIRKFVGVDDVAVVGEKHPVYGEIVKAYVVSECEDKKRLEEELRSFVSRGLAEYKLPAKFEFIAEIPRSPLGKVLRKYL